jgi:predicted DNA-binding protein (UPF0251 family)
MAEYVKEHGLFKAMKKFQVSRQTVEVACNEHDVKIKEIITHAERKENRRVAAELCKTKPIGEVCKETKMCESKVRMACKEFEVTVIKDAVPASLGVRSFRIIKRLLDGVSQSDIGRELNVSRQYVEQVRDKAVKAGFVFVGGE